MNRYGISGPITITDNSQLIVANKDKDVLIFNPYYGAVM